MKHTFTLASALAVSQAMAGLESVLTNRLMDYAGLSDTVDQVDLAGE